MRNPVNVTERVAGEHILVIHGSSELHSESLIMLQWIFIITPLVKTSGNVSSLIINPEAAAVLNPFALKGSGESLNGG